MSATASVGPLARIHPYVRVYCAAAIIVAAAFVRSSADLGSLGALVVLAAFSERLALRRWLLGATPVVSLITGLAVLALISGTKPEEIRMGPIFLFAVRCYLVYLTFCALASSTRTEDVVRAAQTLRVPSIFTAVAASILRWFEFMRAEVTRANNARILRGGENKSKIAAARDLAHLASCVMVRSFLRAERVASAMECRGFSEKLPSMQRLPVTLKDTVPLAALFTFLAALWVLSP